jgi:anti-sigma factor RsiW
MSEGAHLSDSELAGFVDNRLDQAARHLAMAHLDACAECRAELIAITNLARGAAVSSSQRLTGSSSHRLIVSSWRRGRGLVVASVGALAAGLAGIMLYRGTVDPGEPADTVRAPVIASTESPRIVAVAPRDGASLQRQADRVFTWQSYDSDNYRFVILQEDGTPLWSLDTHDTSLVLPADVSLRPGGTYFWRVDAHADGITASSGTMRLQVPR